MDGWMDKWQLLLKWTSCPVMWSSLMLSVYYLVLILPKMVLAWQSCDIFIVSFETYLFMFIWISFKDWWGTQNSDWTGNQSHHNLEGHTGSIFLSLTNTFWNKPIKKEVAVVCLALMCHALFICFVVFLSSSLRQETWLLRSIWRKKCQTAASLWK